MKLIPASRAAWDDADTVVVVGVAQAPNIIAPRHSGDTLNPVRPSVGAHRGQVTRVCASVISLTTDAARSLEQLDLVGGPLARAAVEHAQRAERVAVGVDQGTPA